MTTIVTKRLTLKKYEWDQHDKYINTMAHWLNDPDIVKYSEQRHKKHDYESQLYYLANGPKEFREIHTSNTFIGTITAHVDENNSVANVGILIGEKEEWSKGYGTEAWQAFCDHLLGNGIIKIEAGCMSPNTGMVRIFQKTGMNFEGYRYRHFSYGIGRVNLEQWARFR